MIRRLYDQIGPGESALSLWGRSPQLQLSFGVPMQLPVIPNQANKSDLAMKAYLRGFLRSFTESLPRTSSPPSAVEAVVAESAGAKEPVAESVSAEVAVVEAEAVESVHAKEPVTESADAKEPVAERPSARNRRQCVGQLVQLGDRQVFWSGLAGTQTWKRAGYTNSPHPPKHLKHITPDDVVMESSASEADVSDVGISLSKGAKQGSTKKAKGKGKRAEGYNAARIEVISWLRHMILDVIGQAVFTKLLHSPHTTRNSGFRLAQSMAPILKLLEYHFEEHGEYPGIGGRKALGSKHDLLSVLLKANMSPNVPEGQRLTDPEFRNVLGIACALPEYPSQQIKLREELMTLSADNSMMDELNSLPYLKIVRTSLNIITGTLFIGGFTLQVDRGCSVLGAQRLRAAMTAAYEGA
ncbi:hypothetical protein DFH09DRAFT_1089843 [Mycena vulgaris]|nr:hypothetical protein DFH09DRAFT_1089843 [Mycena vulgaris]